MQSQALPQMTFLHFLKSAVLRVLFEPSTDSLIWNDFAYFWSLVSGKRLDLTLRDVLLGKLDAEIDMLNLFITLVKLYYLDK